MTGTKILRITLDTKLNVGQLAAAQTNKLKT